MIMAARLTVEELQPIARSAVGRYMASWLKALGHYDDAVQEVWMALVKAQGLYDPSRGVPEAKYLQRRARGAVIDFTDKYTFRRRLERTDGAAKRLDCWNIAQPARWQDIIAEKESIKTDRWLAVKENVGASLATEEFKAAFLSKFTPKQLTRAKIVWAYLAEDKLMKDVAAEFGSSECWVCQVVMGACNGAKWFEGGRRFLEQQLV